MPNFEYEERIYSEGFSAVCGCDEAGRGPLCGPVVAAAVILPLGLEIEGLNDSKKLTPKKRDKLFDLIREKAVAYATIEINKLRQAIGVEASVEERTKLGQTDYFCHVSLSDAGLPLMNLSLFAPNRIHAEMMAERFRKDPLTVYQKVLQILTGTDDSPKDENKTTEE